MKKIFYIAFIAAMTAAVSCTDNQDLNPTTYASTPIESLTLKFSCIDMETRAETVDGLNNENLIKKIDYYFFPAIEQEVEGGEDGETEFVVEDDTEYAYHDTFTPADNGLHGEYTTTIQTGALNKIFPNGAEKAVVFAIANYVDKYGTAVAEPNTTIPEDAKTWKALHELEVGETFFYDDQNPDFLLRWPRVMQPNDQRLYFVMTSDPVVIEHLTTGSKAIEAEVPLKRLASKVTVNFTFAEKVVEHKESGDITWVPQPSGVETRVYLSNAIEHTTIGGPLSRDLVGDSWGTATMPLGNGTRDIFEYAYDFLNDITTTTEDGKKLAHYYTYPISLEEGDDNQPYLKLVLPWYGYKFYGQSNQEMINKREVYYKIVIPRGTICDPNYIYEYSVDVSILGSEKEVSITGDYVVKDWPASDPVSSNVATGRYISLDIPRDEYDMYVDEIDIAFVSSGKVEAFVDEIYQMDLSTATPTRQEFMSNNVVTASNALKTAKGITNADIEGWVSIPEETSYLKINHAMDNNMFLTNGNKNTAFDMSPYIFKVTLHLEAAGDDHTFDRTVTIKQYPSLSISAKPSNGYVYVNGYYNLSSENASTDDPTYWAFDDSKPNNVSWRNSQESYVLGSVTGYGQDLGSSNNNTNMYAIKASIIKGFNFIIGDPRGEARQLSNLSLNGNYRPAKTDDDARNVVSPYFLTSSAYSKTILWIRDFERAEKRCAAFQEAGYPAGRWRLPTEGEISFMVELSNNNFIPSLFMGCPYWASSGRLYNPETKNFITAAQGADIGDNGVRCIYDLWYWGEEPNETTTSWLGFKD